MADTLEKPNIDREQFRQDTGVEVPLDQWQPLRPDAREKLAALKNEIATTQEADKKLEKALAFIEANKAPITAVAGAGALAANEVRAELQNAIGDVGIEVKKAIGPWALMFTDISKAKAEDVAGSVKELLAKKEALTNASLFSDPLGWIQKIFFGLALKITGSRLQKAGVDMSKFLSEEERKLMGVNIESLGDIEKEQEKKSSESPSYISTVGIIRKFFLPNTMKNAGELYSYASFSTKSFSQLETAYNNRKAVSLRSFFSIPQSSKLTDSDLEVGLSCLVDPKNKKGKLFRKQLDRTFQGVDYNHLPMNEIFGKLANPLSYLKALASAEILNNPTEIFDSFGFDINEKGEATGELAGKVDILSPGVRKTLFVSTFTGNKFTNAKAAMEMLEQASQGQGISEKDKAEFQKVFQFGEEFRSKVLNNPQIHLGMRSSFEEAFDKKGLTFFGLGSLYCMMDGKTDFENMTPIEKLAFYGGCATIMSGLDSFSKGEFSATYLKKISSNSPDIPQEVKDVGSEFLSGIPQKAGSALWEFLKTLGGAIKGAPEYALGGLVLWYFGGKIRKSHHNFIYH